MPDQQEPLTPAEREEADAECSLPMRPITKARYLRRALADLKRLEQENAALMGNPEAVHQGAAHSITALRQVEAIAAERDQLKSENERLKADEKRMDCLTRMKYFCGGIAHEFGGWRFQLEHSGTADQGNNLRDAIDAAIQREGQ